MSRPSRRIVVGSSILSCALVGTFLLNREQESAPDQPRDPQASAARPKVAAEAVPAEAGVVAAATAAVEVVPPVPAATLTTEDRGTVSTFEIALDEAIRRLPNGKDLSVRLDPPATLATLRSRLKEMDGEVLPVCYEPGQPHDEMHRRLITRDITVKLPSPDADPVLPPGVVLKEKPDHAPGYAVVSAEDPFAALAALEPLRSAPQVDGAEIQLASLRFKRTMPNDPKIAEQWHLKFQNQVGAVAGTDVNVEGAWNYGGAGGVKGTGVSVGIVDDGVDTSHADFVGNIDTVNDKDWNGNDADPRPEGGDDHGTACAGNVGARGNNGIGVSGTAPESKIVGMRLISAMVTDSQEAEAMSHLPQLIAIKSNSWGPSDNASTLEAPGPLTQAAFANMASTGRGNLGTIFTWAGGNGRDNGDNSNFDGYANSIYTIGVGAVNSNGGQSYYSESGANLVIVAPSNGTNFDLGITTVDRTGTAGYNPAASASGGDYTNDFGGTSSATPTAAGVIALMLEKKPGLGWRDVKEILIRSANKFNPLHSGWADNSAGFHFNHSYGAGLIDATAAVNMAATWTNLTPATSKLQSQSGLSLPLPDSTATGVTTNFTFGGSEMRVEHVQVTISATHPYRGDLEVILTSPSGMVSRMAESRGDPGDNYAGWTFSSVRHWGENSRGVWSVKVADREPDDTGTLTALSVKLHGVITNEQPVITAASLTPASQAFTDQTVSVTGITATDVENAPLSYSYLWEKSADTLVWTSTGVTSATLPAGAVEPGHIVRCRVEANDGSIPSDTFITPVVNLLLRPPATANVGVGYSYDSGLVLRNASASAVRDAILNEFSQGASANMEWVEILVINRRSFRNWSLTDKDGNSLVFANSAVWDDIPAGTLIVIYQGFKDAEIPADDLDPAGGSMVLSSANSSYFTGAWPGYVDTGDAVVIKKEAAVVVAGITYGTVTLAGVEPHLSAVAATATAGNRCENEPNASLLNRWQVTTSSKTPCAGGSPQNTTFITNLRSGVLTSPSQFRFGASAQVPAGLSIDSATGVVSGTPTGPAGDHLIVIERFNANGEIVSQSYTLTVSVVTLSDYEQWIAGYPGLSPTGGDDDADGDGMENLLEYYLGSLPGTPDAAGALPVIVRTGNTLTLTWWHLKAATDPEGTPQWSDNLATWQDTGFNTVKIDETPEKEQLRATLTVEEGDSRRFLRLKVE